MTINSNKPLILDGEIQEDQETRLLHNILTKFFEANTNGYDDEEITQIVETTVQQENKNNIDFLQLLIRHKSQPRVASFLAFCYHLGILGANLDYNKAFTFYN